MEDSEEKCNNPECVKCQQERLFPPVTPPETSSWDISLEARVKDLIGCIAGTTDEYKEEMLLEFATSEYKRGVEEGQKNMLVAIEKMKQMTKKEFEDLRAYLDNK